MKRKNIAVLMTALDSDGQAEILKGIESFGKENGCNIAVFLWFTGAYEQERHNLGEINITKLPDLNLFDGVILLGDVFHLKENKEYIENVLEKVTCPIVTIGCKYKQAPAVWADNYVGMRSLMEYLVCDKGMSKIHFVKGIEGNVDAEARFKAYVDVLTENGIRVTPERITQGDFYVLGGEKAAKEVLQSKLPFPEAIVCANDTMAITVYDVLTKKGYRIPEDVIITGYDYTFECSTHYPQIISVKVNEQEMGAQACKRVLRLCAGKKVESDYMVPDEVMFERETNMSILIGDKDFFASDTVRRKLLHNVIILERNSMEYAGYNRWLDNFKFFIEQIDPTEFYLCTNEDFVTSVFEHATVEQETMSDEERLRYSEKVDVTLAYKNGQFMEKNSFESRLAMDTLFEKGKEGKLYIFSPFHYLTRNFGYFVFVENDFPIKNQLYISWLNYMGNSIENTRKQTMLVNAMVKLDDMYVRDSLTGVYNRFGMERYFAIVKEKCIDLQTFMQLSFADVDGLKTINDVYGHEEGDRVIRAVGQILQQEAHDAYVVRYGGDEFVVMGTAFSEKEVESYWTRVQNSIAKYNAEHEGQAEVSISSGYDLVRLEFDSNMEDCIQEADQRMYAAKNKKKALKREAEKQVQ